MTWDIRRVRMSDLLKLTINLLMVLFTIGVNVYAIYRGIELTVYHAYLAIITFLITFTFSKK